MKKISLITTILFVLLLTSCAPYKKSQVLFEYEDLGVLYYLEDKSEAYKYSEFIYDDITNGEYKIATPNIVDYKTGKGALDYDIPAYVNARMDFAIKVELINKHALEVDNMCEMIRSEKFLYKKSYIYFYDKSTKKSTLLCDLPVTNITYDDEFPNVTFDVDDKNTDKIFESFKDRKIKLSDIIAANSTPNAFMKILFAQGKGKRAYLMDRRVDNDDMYKNAIIASKSSIK